MPRTIVMVSGLSDEVEMVGATLDGLAAFRIPEEIPDADGCCWRPLAGKRPQARDVLHHFFGAVVQRPVVVAHVAQRQ